LKRYVEALAMFAADPDLPKSEVRKVRARLKAMRDLIDVLD
jgi:hypothetical protein